MYIFTYFVYFIYFIYKYIGIYYILGGHGNMWEPSEIVTASRMQDDRIDSPSAGARDAESPKSKKRKANKLVGHETCVFLTDLHNILADLLHTK